MDEMLELAARRRDRFLREVKRLDAFIELGREIIRAEAPRQSDRPAMPRAVAPMKEAKDAS